MSRSTKYIGLNQYALDFMTRATRVRRDHKLEDDVFGGDPIMGSVYYLPPPYSNLEYRFKEIVQCVPWSSGPMIFTCLAVSIKREDGKRDQMGKMFQWMVDPILGELGIEYDRGTGRLYF